jgi:hypothetical protein
VCRRGPRAREAMEKEEERDPITFDQLPGSAKMTPYLSATGTTPATNQESHRRSWVRVHFDLGV